jgi:hypothetical protein
MKLMCMLRIELSVYFSALSCNIATPNMPTLKTSNATSTSINVIPDCIVFPRTIHLDDSHADAIEDDAQRFARRMCNGGLRTYRLTIDPVVRAAEQVFP